jgi:glyoxylase-like metal-dependent hydrolase (beta-lactamase superfamily II)
MLLSHPVVEGITVLERGWLSSNNVLLHGEGAGAALIDTGYVLHAAQTVALVQGALRDEHLACVVNTHLHSDHCGGNAALQRAFDPPVFIPPGQWDAVRAWDDTGLGYRAVGQACERFHPQGTVTPGETLHFGRRSWQVLAAPGHDPDAVMLYDERHGVLISGDALWETGFGVVFPEIEGRLPAGSGFDEVEQVLDLISSIAPQVVIPGHGGPFTDVPTALQVARSRLAFFRAEPDRHRRHAAKVLLKYHLLEVQQKTVARLHLWASDTPMIRCLWEDLGRPEHSLHAWCDRLIDEMVRSGAMTLRHGTVANA